MFRTVRRCPLSTMALALRPEVPLLIPEVNPDHLSLIPVQQRNRGWAGFIVTNPNCSTTHLVSALHPLHHAFQVEKISRERRLTRILAGSEWVARIPPPPSKAPVSK